MKQMTLLIGWMAISGWITIGANLRADDGTEIPKWFLEHVERSTEGSGVWVTSNEAYRSETEQLDAYGLVWRKGVGGKSLIGRLYGIQNGKDVATFWELRTVWHPGDRVVYAYQFGSDGTFGVGEMNAVGKGSRTIDQVFYQPSGSTFRVVHDDETLPTGALRTTSYDVDAEDKRTLRRTHIWKRMPAATPPADASATPDG